MPSANRRIVPTPALHRPVRNDRLLYSHVVVAEGRRMIFVAGQLARDREGNVVGKGDMRAQIRQVGENIKAALAAAGTEVSQIVKTTTYVTDIEEFFKHIDVRADLFGAEPPRARPSRCAASPGRIFCSRSTSSRSPTERQGLR
jgi:enamine deaminase RidA (YjgF/YER057c/UK114 family)